MKDNKHIYITKARIPHEEHFFRQCRDIFKSSWITNNGQYVRKLEHTLTAYLGVSHLLVCNNGTTSLMIALQCAGLAGKKVVVTPYTYVATLSALLWIGCDPVFVDIEPNSFCLSPELLEEQLSLDPDIVGVLAVQIYGLACDVDRLDAICKKYSVVLIYDAAQAFGSRYNGKSLLDYGDYSICSFHATKIFHTAEGGCVISHSPEAHKRLALARAFGHINDVHYSLGINGKMSELHAALGLSLLAGTDKEIAKRKYLHTLYDEALADLDFVRPAIREGLEWNYAYYPILLTNEADLICVKQALLEQKIISRRYFYPELNTMPYLEDRWRTSCPVAENAGQRVLCLPMYGELSEKAVDTVASVLKKLVNCSHGKAVGA